MSGLSKPTGPVYDCASCKQPGQEFFYDKRYKQSICRNCFLTRRTQAAAAMDTEWFCANVPFDQFTEEEKRMTGIASLEEFTIASRKPSREEAESEAAKEKLR